MAKIHFGHCIGCDQPIRPPFLSFKVMQAIGDGSSVDEWEEVDVCDDCAGKLFVEELFRLVAAASESGSDDQPHPTAAEIEAAKSPQGGWDRETLARWGVPWPPPKGWKDALLNEEVASG